MYRLFLASLQGTGYSPILPNLKSSNQAVYMQQSGMYSGAGPQFYPAGVSRSWPTPVICDAYCHIYMKVSYLVVTSLKLN